jgi:hypothetical protein
MTQAVDLSPAPISIRIPLVTVSEANARGHWSLKAKRAKKQRSVTALTLKAFYRTPPEPPLVITITRIAPRNLDDDNLASAEKAVRDGVADWLCQNDGDPRLTWRYAQERPEKGGPRYAVRIEVTR